MTLCPIHHCKFSLGFPPSAKMPFRKEGLSLQGFCPFVDLTRLFSVFPLLRRKQWPCCTLLARCCSWPG